MRNIFWFLLFISTVTLGQSVDGALKTLTASGSGTYAITEGFPASYDSKERFNIRFTNAPVTPSSATLNRSGLGAKALKRNDGSVLQSGDITAGNAYLISYNGTYYQCETCGTALTTGNLSTSTTGISFTGATGAVVGSGTTINIQNSTNSQPGLLTAADHTSFNAKVDRAGDTMSGALAMGSNKITGLAAGTANGDAVRYEQLNALLPTGSVTMWVTTSAPAGWLLCDGSAVSRATYANLFAVISTTFGVGDGSTTFNLPNAGGKFPVGYTSGDADYNAINNTGGEKTHTLITSELPVHNHGVTDPGHTHFTVYNNSSDVGNVSITNTDPVAHQQTGGAGDNQYQLNSSTLGTADVGLSSSSTTGITTNNSGSGAAHENRPPYLTLVFIIKI